MRETPSIRSDDNGKEITRRQAFAIGAAAVSGLTGLGIAAFFDSRHTRQQQEKFLKLLQANPLSGEIAYATDDEIKILPATQLPGNVVAKETFQVGRPVTNLAWLDENSLLFTGKAHDLNELGTTESLDKKFDYSVVSDGLFMLDRRTGSVSTLFDPYTSAAESIFGKVQEEDANEEKRLETMMNEETSGIKLVYGNYSSLQIAQIGLGADGRIHIKAKGDWFEIGPTDQSIALARKLPKLVTEQISSSNGMFKLETEGGAVRLTDGHAPGIEFEKGSSYPAWYQTQGLRNP